MPKRKLETLSQRDAERASLQLYHAKAETVPSSKSVYRIICCNFTMPKRKRHYTGQSVQFQAALQLYHAKAETTNQVKNNLVELRTLQLYHAKAET